ncbi:phosphotransferase [candidate division KSB1 bacterium]|nr:phosphotransferase [candidate division KSB1 bacterium]
MNDHKLPELARALNNEEMRSLFSLHLARYTGRPEGPFSGREIRQLRHLVLKHTPGKRCVIQYWLELDGSSRQERRVIGKMYRFNRGEKIFANLRALWNAVHSPNHRETVFGMPQPLAYLSELGMIIQDVVPGRQLSRFTTEHYLPQAVRRVARNLATLHGLAVSVSEKKDLTDHIKKYCHPGPEVLGEVCPELRPLVESILNGLAAADKTLQTAPVCPVHGDLGLSQIFVGDDRAFFIDFDGFCLSHAALDLSNFLVALKVHFELQSGALAEAFLQTYLESQSPEKLAGLRIYHALTYLRRAMICFRWKTAPEWRQQVRQLLERSNAALQAGST